MAIRKTKIRVNCTTGEREVIEFEVSEERRERERADQERHLRVERDRALAATDWTQLPDAPAAVKKDAKPLRKRLRDWPETQEFRDAVESGELISPPTEG